MTQRAKVTLLVITVLGLAATACGDSNDNPVPTSATDAAVSTGVGNQNSSGDASGKSEAAGQGAHDGGPAGAGRFEQADRVDVDAGIVACPSVTDGGTMTAERVPLQNATATFSQESFGGNPVAAAIDGVIASNNGWAIYSGTNAAVAQTSSSSTAPQVAVFETLSDVAGPVMTIKMHHLHPQAGHSLGRFRLSVTNDARSEFADGKPRDGDVTANWVVLRPVRATASGGISLVVGKDDSVLAAGAATETVYSITAVSPLALVTGFRVEALADPGLPDEGPGLYVNGNFVLTEFVVESSAGAAPDGACGRSQH